MLKQFLIYSTGAIILRAITALSILCTIKFITPAEFGLLALINNCMVFLPIILNIGLRQVLAIEFHDTPNPWILVWQLFIIYLGIAFPIATLLFFKLELINRYLFLSQASNYLLILALLTSLLNFMPELLFQLLRFQKKAFLLTSMQIIMGLVLASANIYLLYFKELGLISVLWAQLITQFTASLFFICLLAQNSKSFSCPSFKQALNYLKTGLPFVPNIIFAWLILASNRWLLSRYLPLEQVGIYSFSENISLFFQTLITQPLMHSFLPIAFGNFAQHKANIRILDKQYNKYACSFIILWLVIIPLGFWLFKPIMFYLLPAAYLTALPLITPLLIAQAIFAATHITSASIQFVKKTYYLPILMALGAILNICLNIWMIPIIGFYSCAIGTNLAYLCYFVGIMILKKYVFPKSVSFLNTSLEHRQT